MNACLPRFSVSALFSAKMSSNIFVYKGALCTIVKEYFREEVLGDPNAVYDPYIHTLSELKVAISHYDIRLLNGYIISVNRDEITPIEEYEVSLIKQKIVAPPRIWTHEEIKEAQVYLGQIFGQRINERCFAIETNFIAKEVRVFRILLGTKACLCVVSSKETQSEFSQSIYQAIAFASIDTALKRDPRIPEFILPYLIKTEQ